MIEKIRIRGYRRFKDIVVIPNAGMNILVGANESGKSTIIEAINMAMTGRINGKPIAEELNPYWFNKEIVQEFFDKRAEDREVALPTISIEVFLVDDDALQLSKGAHNSDIPTRACPGVEVAIEQNPDYQEEIDTYLGAETSILPVEYYKVVWRTFADTELMIKPKGLSTALIDSRTIRSTSAIDYHLRQMLSNHLEPSEKAAISVAYRMVKEKMTTEHLVSVNEKMCLLEGTVDEQKLGLAMDQSSRSSWDSNVSPHVGELPFAMAGMGQQVAVKIALAMKNSTAAARVVMIEEPENHLSHTSLNKLVARIESLKGEHQQLFATTHSSFVLNRLGLDALLLLSDEKAMKFDDISDETVKYFRKLPGYDTLRLVLAGRVVLVEGPSDEIVFEKFYKDTYSKRPIEDGIDVISMRGLSLKRCLELAKLLDKCCVGIRDNDDRDPTELRAEVETYLDDSRRKLFIGDVDAGKTLEPQLINANEQSTLREVLGISDDTELLKWMTNNKTEAAIRIADSDTKLVVPSYIADAINSIHEN